MKVKTEREIHGPRTSIGTGASCGVANLYSAQPEEDDAIKLKSWIFVQRSENYCPLCFLSTSTALLEPRPQLASMQPMTLSRTLLIASAQGGGRASGRRPVPKSISLLACFHRLACNSKHEINWPTCSRTVPDGREWATRATGRTACSGRAKRIQFTSGREA